MMYSHYIPVESVSANEEEKGQEICFLKQDEEVQAQTATRLPILLLSKYPHINFVASALDEQTLWHVGLERSVRIGDVSRRFVAGIGRGHMNGPHPFQAQ